MKNFSNRKGFTLVELLIVIVVIGVLSAMMMLSSTEAVSSAKASNIISNLRNLKTAVLSWYTDNLDRIFKVGNKYYVDGKNDNYWFSNLVAKNSDEIKKYLNNDSSITIKGRKAAEVGEYIVDAISDGDVDGKLFIVGYRTTDKNVQQKLASRANSLRLLNGTKDNGPGNNNRTIYTGGEYVYMEAMLLE